MDQQLTASPAGPSKLRMKLRLATAIVGTIVGFVVFPIFAFKFHNWSAAIWGLLSGLVAAFTLFVHVQYMREVWSRCVKPLSIIMLMGCFVQLAGVCGFVTYLTLAIVEKIPFDVYGTNYWVVLVWCFMTFKWGFFLFFCSRSYRNLYTGGKRNELSTVPYGTMNA